MGCSVLLLAGLASSLGGLVFGYELAVISGALLQLRAEFGLSCFQQEALVSSLLGGALLASAAGGWLIDRHGRRSAILLSNVLVLLGSLVLLLSSYAALLVGRVTVGFAIGISSMSCCILVSEVVTPERRGFVVTLYEAGIAVGILAAYAVNYALSRRSGGWRWMFALAAAPTLAQLVSLRFLPSGAEGTSGRGYAHLHKDQEEDEQPSSCRRCDTLYLFGREDNMRRRTALGLSLVLLQQLSGQPNLLLYASSVLRSLGLRSAPLAAVGLGLVKVVATLGAMVCSDRVGRRPLLVGGCCVMALSLLALGLLSGPSLVNAHDACQSDRAGANRTLGPLVSAGNQSFSEAAPAARVPEPSRSPQAALNWLVLLCMMAAVSAYSLGFGPLTWLLLSEIFPAAVRGRAFAFSNCFNWAANLLVTFTFLHVTNAVGLSGTFILYGLMAAGAAVFFYFLLPETKGKTLEQIDQELRSNRFLAGVGCWGVCGSGDTPPQYQRVRCHVSSTATCD